MDSKTAIAACVGGLVGGVVGVMATKILFEKKEVKRYGDTLGLMSNITVHNGIAYFSGQVPRHMNRGVTVPVCWPQLT